MSSILISFPILFLNYREYRNFYCMNINFKRDLTLSHIENE